MTLRGCSTSVAFASLLLAASPAVAQDRPAALVEGAAGLASFVDDAYKQFVYVGGSGRAYVTPRVAIGPEFIYMRGPDESHQWHLTGNVTVDLLRSSPQGRRVRVMPYLVAAGGYQRMTNQVGTGPFTSSEGSVSGGFGARIHLDDRWFVAPEFRMGWELHFRYGATLGARF